LLVGAKVEEGCAESRHRWGFFAVVRLKRILLKMM